MMLKHSTKTEVTVNSTLYSHTIIVIKFLFKSRDKLPKSNRLNKVVSIKSMSPEEVSRPKRDNL